MRNRSAKGRKLKKATKKKNFEIRFYENLIEKHPNFINALISLGDAYTKKGFYKEGLEVDRKLTQLKPDGPIVHYNLACSLSLVEELNKSLKALKKAVLLGYDDFSYLLKDPDLENIRKLPEFKNFLARFKRLSKLKT